MWPKEVTCPYFSMTRSDSIRYNLMWLLSTRLICNDSWTLDSIWLIPHVYIPFYQGETAPSLSSLWIQVDLKPQTQIEQHAIRTLNGMKGFTQRPLELDSRSWLNVLSCSDPWNRYGSSCQNSTRDTWDPRKAQHSKWHHSLLVTLRWAFLEKKRRWQQHQIGEVQHLA